MQSDDQRRHRICRRWPDVPQCQRSRVADAPIILQQIDKQWQELSRIRPNPSQGPYYRTSDAYVSFGRCGDQGVDKRRNHRGGRRSKAAKVVRHAFADISGLVA